VKTCTQNLNTVQSTTHTQPSQPSTPPPLHLPLPHPPIKVPQLLVPQKLLNLLLARALRCDLAAVTAIRVGRHAALPCGRPATPCAGQLLLR